MPVERRHHPRVETHLSADIVNGNEKSMEATITDLSAGGLTLEGSTKLVKHIEIIDADSGEPRFPIEASVVFKLPTTDAAIRIKVACRLVHKRRLAQDLYRISMVILEFNDGQRAQLARHVDTINAG